MQIRERKLPWWLIIVTGVIIIAAGIFVLVDRISGLKVLVFLTGIGMLAFGIYNFIIAIKARSRAPVFIAYLVHGIINIVLLLLIVIIRDTSTLLGVILACWLMAFGVFEIIAGRQEEEQKRSRLGLILAVVGLALLIIPLVFSINYLVLIGVVGIIFGVLRIALGIWLKANEQQQSSKVV